MEQEQIDNIVKVVRQFGDWCSSEKTTDLVNIVSEIGDGAKIAELGVFRGQSAFSIALAMKALKHEYSELFAIDPWSTEACLEGVSDEVNNEWWKSVNMNAIYKEFTGAITVLEVDGFVETMRMKSEEAADKIVVLLDAVHIDGNHSEEKSVQDVELWLPKVKQGGYIIMDDINWVHTQKAVKLINKSCKKIKIGTPEQGSHYGIYKKK